MEFYDMIKTYDQNSLATLSPVELYDIYQDLDEVSHLNASDHLVGHILKDPEVQQVLPSIRRCYSAFFDHHERHMAYKMCNSKNPWKLLNSFPLYPRYKDLIETQIKMMDLYPGDSLAFVGCGPLPISLMLLSRLYGINCIGLDSNSEAVALAKNCIQCLNLQEKVRIIDGDESLLKKLDWNAVLIAALAEPKDRIFRALLSAMKDIGPRPICYRTYSGMRAVLHCPVQAEDIKGFRIAKEILPKGKVNNTLVILESEEVGC